MGRNSTFYFPPPTEPKNPYLLPAQQDWFHKLGKHQAGWFDRYGFGYMTREVFDAFYPGYGSEWPTLQGGLGVLWEQASARGMVIDRDDETQLSYADGVRNHYISALATLEFAAEHRRQLLASFYQAKKRGVQLGSEGDVKHYFLPRSARPQRTRRLAKILHQNGIEVFVLNESINLKCTNIDGGREEHRNIATGSFHIPVAQPTGILLRALIDRRIDMDEKFLRRQLERNQLRLPDEIYDVTAWSLPLAFDVPCLATGESADVKSSRWNPSDRPSQSTALAKARVAYLLPGTDGAVTAMASLIQQDVRVHVCDEQFTIGGRRFERGTLIVKVNQNDAHLRSRLINAAQKFGVEVVPTDTAFVEQGAHMGGPKVHWVRPPTIALVVNRPTNYASGHTWHLFDEVLKYPTTRVKGRDFGRLDLAKFNTVVLPDGNYTPEFGFDSKRGQELNAWVQNGGTLILLRGAASWAADEEIKLLKNKIVKRKIGTDRPDERASDDTRQLASENRSKHENRLDKNGDDENDEVPPDSSPGAFLRGAVFQKHWVTFGYEPSLDVFYTGRLILSPTKETAGRSLVTFVDREELLTSGFCWPATLDLLAQTPYVVYRPVGKGHVIAFTDDPNFRAMYPSIQRLFINAAMFGAAH